MALPGQTYGKEVCRAETNVFEIVPAATHGLGGRMDTIDALRNRLAVTGGNGLIAD